MTAETQTQTQPSLDVRIGREAIDAGANQALVEDMASLPTAVSLRNVHLYYGAFRAVKDVSLDIPKNRITALIGPSGCGKSTLLRSINRMNDLIPSARVEGEILFHDENLYADYVDPVEVRRRIGMVFQKANPFPKSIYDNIAFGPRITGMKGDMDQLVESCLRRAALWGEVNDKLGEALDPRSTLQIEELMAELKEKYTIIIVTHNMQQAARASDFTVFLNMDDDRAGHIVEQGPTAQIFTNPKNQMTEDYVSGRFG